MSTDADRRRLFFKRLSVAGSPMVMGVVNVTPDSFSDGGHFVDHSVALDHAMALLADGADILDIGGESSRPGAVPVGEAEEQARVTPFIEALRARSDALISVDTMKPAVARAAMAAGADIWNDVSALGYQANSAETAAEIGAPVVLMHMQGEPATMQERPDYADVVSEICGFLKERIRAAVIAGVPRDHIVVDPGIGFGKTVAHNLALMRGLPEIEQRTGRPVLLGASRKSFIAALDQAAPEAQARLGGSLAAALWAAKMGARIVRVHDVRETVQALAVWSALEVAQ